MEQCKICIKRGFLTHTNYLNWEWNYNLTQTAWKNEIYSGNDEYNGQTAQKYINDHLGYRFVVRNSGLPYAAEKGKTFTANTLIENVGFGNITAKEKLTYILKDEDGAIYELTPKDAADPKKFLSRETTKVSSDLTLPEDIKTGEYRLYMRISEYGDVNTDNNFRCIRFANGEWDGETGSNLIGSFKVIEKKAPETLLKYLSGLISKTELEKYGTDFDHNNDGKTNILDVAAAL